MHRESTSKFKLRLILLFIVLSINVILFHDTDVYGIENKKHVLYISSYNENFESVPLQIEGIKSVLSTHDIQLDVEYMDTKRFDTLENEVIFYNMLKYKLDHLPPYNAIVVGDDAALQFAMNYQNDLFHQIPIVFLGINNFIRAQSAVESSNITGIIEEMYLKENIELAKKINSKAKKVVAIVDDTLTGIGDKEQFYQIEDEFDDLVFEDINVSEYTFQELEIIFENIENDTILLYLSMYTDKTGENLTIPDAVNILKEHTKVPIYRAEVGGVGNGVLGGRMVSYTESGIIAANMVLDILNGTPVDSIEMITSSPYKYIFDYELIKKYDINEELIPSYAVYINKKLSFYEENKEIVRVALIIFIILFAFSILLFIDNIKTKKVERALNESHVKLTDTYEELSATEEELRVQYVTVQEHAYKIEKLNRKNEHLAQHDYLTNLPNRMVFMKKLGKEIEDGEPGAIMLLDLDNFKDINDNLGHSYGDMILKEIADRLLSLVDDNMFVSRFGGDEFLILISKVNSKDEIKKYINKIKSKFQQAFTIDNIENHIQFSIGVSRYPHDCSDANQLIMNADTAMYKVKQSGKNDCSLYHSEMQEEIKEKAEIEYLLRQAVKNDGFMLLYQPQVSVITGEIISFEALLRFKSNNIPPDKFIGIAEDTGLIIDIGRWVTKEAIKQLVQWKAKGFKLKTVAINFSSKQIKDTTYLEFLKKTLWEYDIDPKYIEIEITESILMEKSENTLTFLNSLKELGVKLALDDFGTGFSSLNYLTYIPVNKLKLDKSLSDKFLELDNIKVMDSIISLAHSLNLEITAEGIEEHSQYKRLKIGECDYIQGYLFSRPLEAKEIEKIYDSNLLTRLNNQLKNKNVI